MSRERIAVLLMMVGVVACASRRLHIRGELDRTTWVVRSCEAPDAYRVMMTSGQAADFIDLERRLAPVRSEPVVLEFDGETIPPKFPWQSHETVGVRGPMAVTPGTCASPAPH